MIDLLRLHYGMIDSFTLSHGTRVNRESLSAQTKLDTTMCPEGKQRTDKLWDNWSAWHGACECDT